MPLKQRRPQHKWTPSEVASDVEAAFHGDTSETFVRAAAIVRYPYERMTKETVAQWEQDAAEDWPDKGLPTHGAFLFDLDDDIKFSLFMDHDHTAPIDHVESRHSFEEARDAAREWIGEPCEEAAAFRFLPGLYQAALIEMVTGVERDWGLYWLGWEFPGDGPYIPYRSYPPQPEEPEDAHHVLMPKAEMQVFYEHFLAAPTMEKVMRQSGFGRRRR